MATYNILGAEGWKRLKVSLAADPGFATVCAGTLLVFYRGDILMSAEVRRDILELEKLRQEIETELARRHNWASKNASGRTGPS